MLVDGNGVQTLFPLGHPVSRVSCAGVDDGLRARSCVKVWMLLLKFPSLLRQVQFCGWLNL